MQEQQPSYYSILTANVRYDKNLSDSEKILYSEITALSVKAGYCFATNSYLAKLYDISKVTVSRRINRLKELGYLKVVVVRDENQQIKRREIYPITDPIIKTDNTPIIKPVGESINEIDDTPIIKTDKDSITSINNTSINKEVEDAPQNDESESPVSEKKSFELWQNNWGFPNAIAQQDLHEWINGFGDELVIHAIEYALRSNVTSRGADRYLWRVFDDYKKYKITTVEQALKKEEEHQQQKSREYAAEKTKRTNYRQPIQKEKLPDWSQEGYVLEVPKSTMSDEERDELKKKLARFRKKEF